MPDKTEKNLAHAFAAESKAAARNAVFAKKADSEDLPQIAKLFRAVSEAESIHARRFLMMMRGKIGSTEENLAVAFENEIKANAEEYPRLIKDAMAENQDNAVKAFSQSRDVETGHAELYKKALNDVIGGSKTNYYVCSVCGYISEDVTPNNCPVCGSVKAKFKLVE
jgi:rubrerythrin